MSKGSKYRPIKNKEQFDDNWDRIFGKEKVSNIHRRPRIMDKWTRSRIDIIGSNGNNGLHYKEE